MKICTTCNVLKPLTDFARRLDAYAYKCKSCHKAWYDATRAERNAYRRKWRAGNKIKGIKGDKNVSKRVAKFYLENPHIAAQNSAKYRSAKRKAIVAWGDDRKISEIYLMASEMTRISGMKFHVDHIVPLVSDIVCGLHWEGNLQILPFDENIKKGNRHWPDMPI